MEYSFRSTELHTVRGMKGLFDIIRGGKGLLNLIQSTRGLLRISVDIQLETYRRPRNTHERLRVSHRFKAHVVYTVNRRLMLWHTPHPTPRSLLNPSRSQ